jgi:predicted dehydrogenase
MVMVMMACCRSAAALYLYKRRNESKADGQRLCAQARKNVKLFVTVDACYRGDKTFRHTGRIIAAAKSTDVTRHDIKMGQVRISD